MRLLLLRAGGGGDLIELLECSSHDCPTQVRAVASAALNSRVNPRVFRPTYLYFLWLKEKNNNNDDNDNNVNAPTQVRICTEAYEAPSDSNINKTTMHLTNYSVNKVGGLFLLGSRNTFSNGAPPPLFANVKPEIQPGAERHGGSGAKGRSSEAEGKRAAERGRFCDQERTTSIQRRKILFSYAHA